MPIPSDYIERCYAGWLAKIIGIRLGAPIEGWTYERILKTFGELTDYPKRYNDFAADDDSNGPMFFLRAMDFLKPGQELTPQHVAEALLNYAPREHGFFWWGGYGVSTEHTAYLNLAHGIPAPRSGSVQQNGSTVAEQIGGQIFIDCWGLVSPNNPEQAARLATAAASVTHGGNGVHGGVFIAVCIALAFGMRDVKEIIEAALAYIPADCEYARAVNAVRAFHATGEGGWRDCFAYIHDNFGYDKYPGNCHIIPNSCVIVMAMLYGENRFSDTINICNMAGWDTDCNVGNVATILGVLNGLRGMDLAKWQPEIHDMLVCSSVLGSLNVMDIPYGASYMANIGYRLAGEQPPEPWRGIFPDRIESCHFEYPTSTHNLRVRRESDKPHSLTNTDEAAFTGRRSLRLDVPNLMPGETVALYKRTYEQPQDYDDSRYDPEFSPLLYPGQTVTGSVMAPEGAEITACLYARELGKDGKGEGRVITGSEVTLRPGEWRTLELTFSGGSGIIREAGFLFTGAQNVAGAASDAAVYVDDLAFHGDPDVTLDMRTLGADRWMTGRTQVRQFTRLTGLLYLEEGMLHLSGADFAEGYAGHHNWGDVRVTATLRLVAGQQGAVLARVQGAQRSYGFGFTARGTLALMKNAGGWHVLVERPFDAQPEQNYELEITVRGNTLTGRLNGIELTCADPDPYLTGCIGLSARGGSHIAVKAITVTGTNSK